MLNHHREVLPVSVPAVFTAEWQAMADAIPDPVFVKDREHRWVAMNLAFCELTGRSREELLGLSDYDASPAEEAHHFWAGDDEVFRTGETNTSIDNHTDRNGTLRVIETKKSIWRTDDGQILLIGVIRDHTELAGIREDLARINLELERIVDERTRELQELAFHDPLTGLPNRRSVFQKLKRRVANNGTVALLFIDVDHFKWINDSKGHPFGDGILRELASRYFKLEGIDMVARLGGDEFVIITHLNMPMTHSALKSLADSALAATREPIEIQGEEVNVSASIGIAQAPRDAADIHDLIRCADTALYRAKDFGRDCAAFFEPRLGTRVEEFAAIETGLRVAIREHAIQVAFQPIISLKDRAVIGVEALARWRDPDLGTISPAKFIPIAESCGLITTLGALMLRKSVIRAKSELKNKQRLSVNVSPRELEDPQFVSRLLGILEEEEFPSDLLDLEITEISAANPSKKLLAALTALRKENIRIGLDDFGTGYSALVQIQHLPIDRIKIDRSFVFELPSNRKSCALVEAMVKMCDALELEVVAEGVETEEQLVFLQNLGCHAIQGFLPGRPRVRKSFWQE